MSFLYIGTFGSFIGYSFAFGLVLQNQFGRTPLQAASLTFIGPLLGSLIRPVGGWLADRYGGADGSRSVQLRRAWRRRGRGPRRRRRAKSLAAVRRRVHRAVRPHRPRQRLDVQDDPGDLPGQGAGGRSPGAATSARSCCGPAGCPARRSGSSARSARSAACCINLAFRQSFLTAKTGDPAFWAFIAFYVVCIAVTYVVYLRPAPVDVSHPRAAYAPGREPATPHGNTADPIRSPAAATMVWSPPCRAPARPVGRGTRWEPTRQPAAAAERTSVTKPVTTTTSSEPAPRGRSRAGRLHRRGDRRAPGGGARRHARAPRRRRPARPGDADRPARRRRGPARGHRGRSSRRPPDITVATTGIGFRGWVEAAEGWGLGEDLLARAGRGRADRPRPEGAGGDPGDGADATRGRRASESSAEVLEHLLARGGRGQADRGAAARRAAAGRRRGADVAGAEVVEVPVYRWMPPADIAPDATG